MLVLQKILTVNFFPGGKTSECVKTVFLDLPMSHIISIQVITKHQEYKH